MVSSLPQRALITGASRGIGKEVAIAFAKAGINLILVSRSCKSMEDVAVLARAEGVEATVCEVDLAEVEQVQEKMSAISAQYGPIDVLVNNAGMGYTGDLLSTSLQDWQKVLDLNLTSVLQCIQAILPGMRDRGRGRIINIASIAAYQAFPGWGAYNVSKAGLIALSKTLAAEERGNGIQVTTICPGAVNTPIWDTDTVQAELDRSKMLTPAAVAATVLQAALIPDGAVVDELTITPSAGSL